MGDFLEIPELHTKTLKNNKNVTLNTPEPSQSDIIILNPTIKTSVTSQQMLTTVEIGSEMQVKQTMDQQQEQGKSNQRQTPIPNVNQQQNVNSKKSSTVIGKSTVLTKNAAIEKCKNYLVNLIESLKETPKEGEIQKTVLDVIQQTIDAKIEPANFCKRIDILHGFTTGPALVDFFKKTIPLLRQSLYKKEISLEGINPPSLKVAFPNSEKNSANSKKSVVSDTPSKQCSKKASSKALATKSDQKSVVPKKSKKELRKLRKNQKKEKWQSRVNLVDKKKTTDSIKDNSLAEQDIRNSIISKDSHDVVDLNTPAFNDEDQKIEKKDEKAFSKEVLNSFFPQKSQQNKKIAKLIKTSEDINNESKQDVNILKASNKEIFDMETYTLNKFVTDHLYKTYYERNRKFYCHHNYKSLKFFPITYARTKNFLINSYQLKNALDIKNSIQKLISSDLMQESSNEETERILDFLKCNKMFYKGQKIEETSSNSDKNYFYKVLENYITEKFNLKLPAYGPILQLKLQLRIILHALKCMGSSSSNCKIPFCQKMQEILEHMLQCSWSNKCLFKSCKGTKALYFHWLKCIRRNCELCPSLTHKQVNAKLYRNMSPSAHKIFDLSSDGEKHIKNIAKMSNLSYEMEREPDRFCKPRKYMVVCKNQ